MSEVKHNIPPLPSMENGSDEPEIHPESLDKNIDAHYPPPAKLVQKGFTRRSLLPAALLAAGLVGYKTSENNQVESREIEKENRLLEDLKQIQKILSDIEAQCFKVKELATKAEDAAYLMQMEDAINVNAVYIGKYLAIRDKMQTDIQQLKRLEEPFNQNFYKSLKESDKKFQELRHDIETYSGPNAFKRMLEHKIKNPSK